MSFHGLNFLYLYCYTVCGPVANYCLSKFMHGHSFLGLSVTSHWEMPSPVLLSANSELLLKIILQHLCAFSRSSEDKYRCLSAHFAICTENHSFTSWYLQLRNQGHRQLLKSVTGSVVSVQWKRVSAPTTKILLVLLQRILN